MDAGATLAGQGANKKTSGRSLETTFTYILYYGICDGKQGRSLHFARKCIYNLFYIYGICWANKDEDPFGSILLESASVFGICEANKNTGKYPRNALYLITVQPCMVFVFCIICNVST